MVRHHEGGENSRSRRVLRRLGQEKMVDNKQCLLFISKEVAENSIEALTEGEGSFGHGGGLQTTAVAALKCSGVVGNRL